MKLIKDEREIILKNDDAEIERYSFDMEINFKKFIEYLLSLNLSVKIDIEDSIDEKTESEENLVKLINNIKEDYNTKVDELIEYKKSLQSKDNQK